MQVAVDSNIGIPVYQCNEYTIAKRGGAVERPISVSQKFNLAEFPTISRIMHDSNQIHIQNNDLTKARFISDINLIHDDE